MTLSKKRQRTLLEYSTSSSPTKPSAKRRKTFSKCSSDEDCNSDPGKIQFEPEANDEEDDRSPHHLQAAVNEDIRPRRYATRKKNPQSSPATSVYDSSEENMTRENRSTPFKQSHHRVVISDESVSPEPPRRHRLVKGRRPEGPTQAEDDEESLIDGVDEDMILNSRLRDRFKKSVYAQNLERLQRRRRGRAAISESEEEGTDYSESSKSGRSEDSAVFTGARQTHTVIDEGGSPDEDLFGGKDETDFIVEDDEAEIVPELPTVFSMGTFQDLSHHFKIICQLFVHLAVKEPSGRHPFMERALKQDYFTVPLAIARRKFSAMRDSLVTSSVWKPEFKNPLETFPIFRLEQLVFSIPMCDACHLGNRVATLRGTLSGHAYDPLTYESRHLESDEEGDTATDWNLGRFCAARAQVFHMFTHWEHILYHTLRTEVDNLKEATTQLSVGERSQRRVFIPATKGPAPPEDLEDADGMMDWLDGRGLINAQWTWIKDLMERARNLETKGRGGEDVELE